MTEEVENVTEPEYQIEVVINISTVAFEWWQKFFLYGNYV